MSMELTIMVLSAIMAEIARRIDLKLEIERKKKLFDDFKTNIDELKSNIKLNNTMKIGRNIKIDKRIDRKMRGLKTDIDGLRMNIDELKENLYLRTKFHLHHNFIGLAAILYAFVFSNVEAFWIGSGLMLHHLITEGW